MENRSDPPLGHTFMAKPITIGSPLVLQASGGTSDRIRSLANDNGVGEAEVVKLAMALMQVYTEAKKQGRRLAVVDSDGNVVEEIAGP
jgi:hypothetical protein